MAPADIKEEIKRELVSCLKTELDEDLKAAI